MAEPTPDTLIDGRYRVVSRLGAGGMADVFLAEDQQLGRKVALKLLYRRFAEDPDFVERFRREAQAAAGLQHPNVVSVYDRGSFDDTYYIAMEYLPGRSLKQIIRQEAPLDPLRAIDITIQILKAARFAHRRGVIHRDLKPHNVIVDDSDHAKVTDFGIARAGASDMTETGSIMGTAQYLSPEQAQGRSVEAGSDLYSIGIVLYEMLTGRVPFDAESAVTIALKHVSEAPIPPHEINPDVPPELEQTVLWVLNKNPADRPQNADQLIEVLEHCRTAIVSRAAGQNTASMAAVMAAGAAGGGAGAALADLPVYPDPTGNGDGAYSLAPEDEPGGRNWLPWIVGALILLLLAGGGVTAYLVTRPKQVAVPPVTGEPFNTARTVLQDSGFQVSPLYTNSSQKTGTVIGESPAGGTKADKHSTVQVTVSQGPSNVTVPTVKGLSSAAATKSLTHAHLKVSHTVGQTSTAFPAGQVTGTDPPAGRSLPPGTGVTLFVSSGPPAKRVPDVTGDTQASATNQLSAAGFNVNTTNQTSSSVSPGDVISQSPGGGSTQATGSTVTIVVATAPTTATVPPVVGDPANGAANALTAAGFKVARRTKAVKNQSKDGTVLSQSPGGGSTQKKGSTVTITVGQFTPSPTSSSSSTTTTKSSSTTPTTSSSSSTTPGQ
ncbi:MAG: Stk1 family PASTA domain-containing Ser/Thr kinase [Solirubrobacteraceae bacterium]